MPEPRRQPMIQDMPFKRAKEICSDFKMRKIRVICYDPEATDSSSSEDEGGISKREKRGKRIVREINLPVAGSPQSNAIETESSCQDSNNGGKNPKKRGGCQGLRVKKARVRSHGSIGQQEPKCFFLGSCLPVSIHNPAVSDDSDSLLSHTSPSSVLELETSTSHYNGGGHGTDTTKEGVGTNLIHANGAEQQKPISDFAEEPLMAPPIGQELNMEAEFESFFDDNNWGRILDDFNCLDDLRIFGFDNEEPSDLPDFDFDLGNDEFAWMDEPLNISCP
ncbi:hypothetical protein CK203_034987 [Vitis vinifera]|uniref:Uncharacterized protein n=1 Tax=Vitis vinifera TaxID=29760 RepID=A0A438FYM6_VITVI|nr:hypothetical protein CK203_034987 [Vitis vinifera]